MYIKEFNVIYTEKKTDEYRLYICKKSLENQLYRIFELADRNKIAEYIKYFNSLNFKDFYGDFSIDEKYYIVFKHPDGIIAGDSDWKKLSAKDIVKALVLQNPPIEIAVPMLSFNNIFVYEKENEIIGYIGLWFLGDQCQITTIATDQKYQGQGYASQLMEYTLLNTEHRRQSGGLTPYAAENFHIW